MAETNKRKHIRAKISVTAQIITESGETIQATVEDLSLNGVLLRADKKPKVGQRCQVLLLIGHMDAELPISANGSVVRAQDKQFAIQFDAVGLGAQEEMKSLIVTHAENRYECLQEFSESALFVDSVSASNFLPIITMKEKK